MWCKPCRGKANIYYNQGRISLCPFVKQKNYGAHTLGLLIGNTYQSWLTIHCVKHEGIQKPPHLPEEEARAPLRRSEVRPGTPHFPRALGDIYNQLKLWKYCSKTVASKVTD